jgi:hypothetical protein
LGTALTAVLQERLGIEHLEAEVGRERVGECLTGTQRNAVLGRQKAEFAVANNRLLLARINVVDEVDEERGMETGTDD